jgi:signal peptidase I
MAARLRYTCLGMLFVAVLALTPFRPLKITGRSMEPTLRHGETYLLDHFYWKSGGLRRNDIVVVDRGEEKWVKRLVGLPGDVLQIAYGSDGWIENISNVTANPDLRRSERSVGQRVVEPGEIFVIGDNMGRSTDSTTQEAGAFKLKDVMGVVRSFTLRREFPFREHP